MPVPVPLPALQPSRATQTRPFTYLGDYPNDLQRNPHTVFLGVFQDEYDAIKNPATEPAIVDSVIKGALHRTTEQWTTLTIDNAIIDTLVIRHLGSKRAAEVMKHLPLEETLWYIVDPAAFRSSLRSVEIEDLVIPDYYMSIVDLCSIDMPRPNPLCSVYMLLKSAFICNLTLTGVQLPWSLFSSMHSLVTLSLEGVAIMDFSHTQRPLLPGRSVLKALRCINSSDLLSKLLYARETHTIGLEAIEDLEIDMGSNQSARHAWTLIQINADHLRRLAIDFEDNRENSVEYPGINMDTSKLHFPNLRALAISDSYNMHRFPPLIDDTYHCLHAIPAAVSDPLESITFAIRNLPVFDSDVFSMLPEASYQPAHANLRGCLYTLDEYLSQIVYPSIWRVYESSHASTKVEMEFTLRSVNPTEVCLASEALYANLPQATSMLLANQGANGQEKLECAEIMKRLRDVPDDPSCASDAEREVLVQRFMSFYMGKLNEARSRGVEVGVTFANEIDTV
ncbi:hypothetical protein NMY22_g16780 [Coprinellus aureogranulatus]|nr:hypothetical protein NMY22_g16780 [Coprinellus aureogranulatus]